MKSTLLAFVLLISITAQAKTDYTKIDALSEALNSDSDESYDAFSIGNGEWSLSDYDMAHFSVQALVSEEMSKQAAKIAELKKADPENDVCVNKISAESQVDKNSFQSTINGLIEKEEDINDLSTLGIDFLKEILAAGAIQDILSIEWDGASGDSEYCAIYLYKIFLGNGQVLYLDYEETD